jgi:hypothetical protein
MAKTMETGRGTGRRMAVLACVTAAVLLTPLIAMQFSTEVKWTRFDFAFAGGLVIGVGLLYELAARAGGFAYRAGAAAALLAALVMIWATGAVGIIGAEGNPGNLMFAGVLAVAAVGALASRFRADGMARTMVLTALAQVATAGIAFAGALGVEDPSWPYDVLAATGVFTALWLLSAGLFAKAAKG